MQWLENTHLWLKIPVYAVQQIQLPALVVADVGRVATDDRTTVLVHPPEDDCQPRLLPDATEADLQGRLSLLVRLAWTFYLYRLDANLVYSRVFVNDKRQRHLIYLLQSGSHR